MPDPDPSPSQAPARALRKILGAMLPIDEVEGLLSHAVAYGPWAEVPSDEEELRSFVRGPLHSALMARYSLEVAEKVVHALARKPSGVRRRASALRERALGRVVALLHDPGRARDSICHILRSGGCDVQIAGTPDAGFMLLVARPQPSLVIVGPELGGHAAEDVAGALRRQFADELPPLLVVASEHLSEGVAGATTVVPSPSRDAVAFLSEVRRLLGTPTRE